MGGGGARPSPHPSRKARGSASAPRNRLARELQIWRLVDDRAIPVRARRSRAGGAGRGHLPPLSGDPGDRPPGRSPRFRLDHQDRALQRVSISNAAACPDAGAPGRRDVAASAQRRGPAVAAAVAASRRRGIRDARCDLGWEDHSRCRAWLSRCRVQGVRCASDAAGTPFRGQSGGGQAAVDRGQGFDEGRPFRTRRRIVPAEAAATAASADLGRRQCRPSGRAGGPAR